MRSSWSLGVVFIAFGGLSVSGIGGHRPLGTFPWVLAIWIITAGAFVFTRTRASFYVALATGALTAVTGILAYVGHPELALPVPPALSIGIGLYLLFRTGIAASAFGKPKPRGFAPRDGQGGAEPQS
jgi:hypothetical protein